MGMLPSHPQDSPGLRRTLRLGIAALALSVLAACGGGGGGGSTAPAAPVATSLVASTAAPLFGGTFTLTPTYSAGTGTIDNSVACPATGVASAAITANWVGAKVYTLTVTNSASVTATTTATVTPQAVTVAAVTPATFNLVPGGTQQCVSSVTGAVDTTVNWSVDTIAGGNATVGTITTAGLYTAGTALGAHTIKATADADLTTAQTATVTVAAAPTAAPAITSFTPATAGAGATVTLTGTTFTGATAVKFNTVAAASFAVVNATTITAVVPNNTASTGAISVTTAAGTGTSATSFTFIPAPAITSFTPASTYAGQTVTLTGTAFTGATAVKFNNIAAASFSVVSATSITAVVPNNTASTGAITVTTPAGTATSASNFTFVAGPVITSFLPATTGVGQTVTLTGTGFTGATAVKFNNVDATSFSVVSDVSITAVVPAGSTGTISVTTAAGTGSSSSTFTLMAVPVVTSFSPAFGPIGTKVTLTGQNFTAATTVKFNNVSATTVTFGSATSITALVPATATTGAIVATTLGGISTNTQSFIVGTKPGTMSILSGFPSGQGNTNTDVATSTVARYWEPNGIAIDTAGNIFISDYDNDAIRKIAIADGAVTTLAGIPGTLGSSDSAAAGSSAGALFYGPAGMAYDGAHTLYVADVWNYTIRTVDTDTGYTTTLAGTPNVPGHDDLNGGNATFHFRRGDVPVGLALNGNNLYVPDQLNNCIRVVDVTSGNVTTLAGVAYDPLQVATLGHTDGLPGVATFNFPTGVAVIGTNLYVADMNNELIRAIDLRATGGGHTLGTVSTLAGVALTAGHTDSTSGGPGPAGALFDSPVCLITDSTKLYETDMESGVIRTILVDGTVDSISGAAGSVGFINSTGLNSTYNGPTALAFKASDSSLLVTDFGNALIRRVSNTNAATTLSGLPRQAGNVDSDPNPAKFQNPLSAALSHDGLSLFVADYDNQEVRVVLLADGTTTTLAGPNTNGANAGLGAPSAVAVDPISGDLFIADYKKHALWKVASGTTTLTSVTTSFAGPMGVAVDASHNVYVADTDNNAIFVIAAGTTTPVRLAGQSGQQGAYVNDPTHTDIAEFNSPFGLAVSPDGTKLYVADSGNNAIRVITLNGVIPAAVGTYAGPTTAGQSGATDSSTPTSARFLSPQGVSVDAAGTLYVADTFNGTLRMVALDGTVSTITGTPRKMANLLPTDSNVPLATATLVLPAGVVTLSTVGTGSNQMFVVVPDAVMTIGF